MTSRRTFLQMGAMAAAGAFLIPADLHAESCCDLIEAKDKALTFLFQGDSITDGNRGRSADPNHIMGHGYAFAVASRIAADFPDRGFKFYNRGISGNRVADLNQRWNADALALKPDVLSILIGINDVGAIVSQAEYASDIKSFETAYRRLLEESKSANADILFVLGLPFVYPIGRAKDKAEVWLEETNKRKTVVNNLAREFNAVTVDYPAVFDQAVQKAPIDYWIWDGIHPTIAGHELMAREWIRKTSARLDFLRVYDIRPNKM